MRITAIIPVFNGERFLGETLQSLLRQSEPFEEIIIIDDGSTDATPSIVEKWRTEHSRIRYVPLDNNRGVSHARNTGVKLARSEWCLFMDSDDLAHPDLLAHYRKRIRQWEESGQRTDMLFCSSEQIDESGRIIGLPSRFVEAEPHEMTGYLFVRNPVVTSSGVMVRRDVVLHLGGFNTGIRYSEDWEFWLKISQEHAIRYADRTLIQVRRHSGNASVKVDRMIENELGILKSYDIDYVRQKILARNIPAHENMLDFVSVAFRLGLWEEGLQQLKRLDEPSEQAFFYRGLYDLHREAYAEAIKWFERTLELNPKNAAAKNNLACCMWVLGRPDEAETLFEEIHLDLPVYMDAYENLKYVKRKLAGENDTPASPKFTWRPLRSVLTVYRTTDLPAMDAR